MRRVAAGNKRTVRPTVVDDGRQAETQRKNHTPKVTNDTETSPKLKL